MTSKHNCPFCELDKDQIVANSSHGLAVRDGFPISPGHTLIVPRRHVASFFDLSSEEQSDLLELINDTKKLLESEFYPQGYNIGINDGPAAGQTVMHLHIHIVPRYEGDVTDPRGGIRWIFPEKANYWDKD